MTDSILHFKFFPVSNSVLFIETKLSLLLSRSQDPYGNYNSNSPILKLDLKNYLYLVFIIFRMTYLGSFTGLHVFMRIKNVFSIEC